MVGGLFNKCCKCCKSRYRDEVCYQMTLMCGSTAGPVCVETCGHLINQACVCVEQKDLQVLTKLIQIIKDKKKSRNFFLTVRTTGDQATDCGEL